MQNIYACRNMSDVTVRGKRGSLFLLSIFLRSAEVILGEPAFDALMYDTTRRDTTRRGTFCRRRVGALILARQAEACV